ncbi:MAG: hypothetical protein JOZ54_22425 [Acidobacteria bacterium]|nr:hypothetical protein [Acidobacteriota bacterium]
MAVERFPNPDASLARQFLLGKLSAEASEQFETRLLEDAELFELVQAVEGDLLDELARGELAGDDRNAMVARASRRPGHARFAQVMTERAGTEKPQTFARIALIAIAALLVIVVGAVLMNRRQPQESPTRPPVVASTMQPAGTPEKVAAITLALASTRGAATPTNKLTLDPDTTRVAITIRLHPADRYARYDVALVGNAPVWRGTLTTDTNELMVSVPAASLQAGRYRIEVAGINGNDRDDLGEQELLITR